MFYITPAGTYVPVQNIKFVRPMTKGGSAVTLKTGEKTTDPRSPDQIFAEMSPAEDLSLVIVSIYDEIRKMQKQIADTTAVVENETQRCTNNVTAAASKLTNAAEKSKRNSEKLESSITSIKAERSSLSTTIKGIQDAIDEINL